MSTMTRPAAPAGLTGPQINAFHEIRDAAEQLERLLLEAKRDIDGALEALSTGRAIAGSAMHGAGPIGHQAPFDIALATQRLTFALRDARRAGLETEAIKLAYTIA